MTITKFQCIFMKNPVFAREMVHLHKSTLMPVSSLFFFYTVKALHMISSLLNLGKHYRHDCPRGASVLMVGITTGRMSIVYFK